MHLTDADIPIGVDNCAQHPGRTWHHLRLAFDRLDLSPLQHWFYNRTIAALLARLPKATDVLVQLLVLSQAWPYQRRVEPVAANDRQIVVIHPWASVEQV